MYACAHCRSTHNRDVRQLGRCYCGCHMGLRPVPPAPDAHLESDYDDRNGDDE